MNKFFIKGPRQQRAVEALLEGPVTVKDMGAKIGALNPRQLISELSKQGFEGIILTRWFSAIDRDGRRCRPGEYYISNYFKPVVEDALKNRIAQADGKCSSISLSTDTNMLTGGIR